MHLIQYSYFYCTSISTFLPFLLMNACEPCIPIDVEVKPSDSGDDAPAEPDIDAMVQRMKDIHAAAGRPSMLLLLGGHPCCCCWGGHPCCCCWEAIHAAAAGRPSMLLLLGGHPCCCCWGGHPCCCCWEAIHAAAAGEAIHAAAAGEAINAAAAAGRPSMLLLLGGHPCCCCWGGHPCCCCWEAIQNIIKAQVQQKRNYNKRHEPQILGVGEVIIDFSQNVAN